MAPCQCRQCLWWDCHARCCGLWLAALAPPRGRPQKACDVVSVMHEAEHYCDTSQRTTVLLLQLLQLLVCPSSMQGHPGWTHTAGCGWW